WVMTGSATPGGDDGAFAAEVSRLRSAGVLGESGRLRELFDYLAARAPDAPPSTQADIAADVCGTDGTDGDDATVRVYVHRLRKRLEEYYRNASAEASTVRLAIPGGTYALRLEKPEGAAPPIRRVAAQIPRSWLLAMAVAALAV